MKLLKEGMESAVEAYGWSLDQLGRLAPSRDGASALRFSPRWQPPLIAGLIFGWLVLPWDGSGRFLGGLLWLRNTDLWSGQRNELGLALARCFLDPGGEIGDLDSCAWEMEGEDLAAASAVLTTGLLYEWDTFFIGRSGLAIEFSHDGYVLLWPGAPGQREEILAKLRKLCPGTRVEEIPAGSGRLRALWPSQGDKP